MANLNNLRLGKVLGEGSYGKVLLATDNFTGEECAVKILDKSKMDKEGLQRVYFEAEIMQKLQHKNILQIKNITEDNENVYIVMKYARNGDLLEYLNSKKRLTEEEAREIFIQLIEALEYTHNKNIIHRDIKLENILIDENNEVIVGDWGFAGYWSNDKKIKCNWGSIFYAAPEIFLGQEYTGPEIDIWSLGVVLYAMITGRLPFSGADNEEIAMNIINENFKLPSYCSKSLSSLISSMLTVNSCYRINMSQIKAHPWVAVKNPVVAQKSEEKISIKQEKPQKKRSIISLIFSKIPHFNKSKPQTAIAA